MAGSIHLFKITGTLVPENVNLKGNLIWYIIEIDWKEVSVTLNGNKINLPKPDTIKFRYKFKKLDVLSEENPCSSILC